MKVAMMTLVFALGCAPEVECVVGPDCICADGEHVAAYCGEDTYDPAACGGMFAEPGCVLYTDIQHVDCRNGEPVPCPEGTRIVCPGCDAPRD